MKSVQSFIAGGRWPTNRRNTARTRAREADRLTCIKNLVPFWALFFRHTELGGRLKELS